MDDDFIDDGDLEEGNEDMLGTELMMAEDNRMTDRFNGSYHSQTTAQQEVEDERERKREVLENDQSIARF